MHGGGRGGRGGGGVHRGGGFNRGAGGFNRGGGGYRGGHNVVRGGRNTVVVGGRGAWGRGYRWPPGGAIAAGVAVGVPGGGRRGRLYLHAAASPWIVLVLSGLDLQFGFLGRVPVT